MKIETLVNAHAHILMIFFYRIAQSRIATDVLRIISLIISLELPKPFIPTQP